MRPLRFEMVVVGSNKSTDAFLIVYELGWNNKYTPTEIIVLLKQLYPNDYENFIEGL